MKRFLSLLLTLALFAAPLAQAQSINPQVGGGIGFGFDGGISAHVKSSAVLPANANLVFEGDSITLGLFCNAPANYPTQAVLQLPSGPTYTNDTIATSGISSLTLDQNYATRGGTAFNGSSALNMLMFMAGTNTSGSTDNTAILKYKLNRDYLRQARNTGYQRIEVGTVTARDDDGGTTWTNILVPLNSFIRTYYNSDMQADGLLDWGNSPFFSPASAALNQTYYNTDFLHPIAAGCLQMANIAAPVMTTNLSSAGTQVFAPTTWSIFDISSANTLSNGNRTTSANTGLFVACTRGFPGVTAAAGQLWYFEDTVTVANEVDIGLANDAFPYDNSVGPLTTVNAIGYRQDGLIAINSVTQATAATFQTGDVIGTAWDNIHKTVWFRRCRSGTCQPWNGSGTANPSTNTGGISISGLYTAGAGNRIYPVSRNRAVGDAVVSSFAASQLVNVDSTLTGFNSGFGP